MFQQGVFTQSPVGARKKINFEEVLSVITVFFRYDDYSSLSPSQVDGGLIDVLRRKNVSCTFAVIPAVTIGNYHDPAEREVVPLSGTKLSMLKQACEDGVVECALHGWNHRSLRGSAPHSEFFGLPLEDQKDRLAQGCEFFKTQLGITPQVFVPPWNSYDTNTLSALEGLNVGCISANRYFSSFSASGLRHLPITIDMRGLRSAIDHARTIIDPDPIIGVLLHPYDFHESGDPRGMMNCEEFEHELGWLAQQSGVQVRTVGVLANENHVLDVGRYLANQPSPLESIFPPFLMKTNDTPVYMTSQLARRVRANRVAVTVFLHLAITVAAWIGAKVVFSHLPKGDLIISSVTNYAALLGMALIGVRAILARRVYFFGMALLSTLVGVWAAIFFN